MLVPPPSSSRTSIASTTRSPTGRQHDRPPQQRNHGPHVRPDDEHPENRPSPVEMMLASTSLPSRGGRATADHERHPQDQPGVEPQPERVRNGRNSRSSSYTRVVMASTRMPVTLAKTPGREQVPDRLGRSAGCAGRPTRCMPAAAQPIPTFRTRLERRAAGREEVSRDDQQSRRRERSSRSGRMPGSLSSTCVPFPRERVVGGRRCAQSLRRGPPSAFLFGTDCTRRT